ncbi:MAG: ribosomal protein S18-alanine N-acetyltransferase [Nitrospirae bacterium]|nr:ribosomal protein S18-alanine N-acetyltransferase [Nitrospirota bacterium]
MEGITIRKMSPADLSEVSNIENLCYSTPWSPNSFKYELANKEAILKVAVFNSEIIGYVCIRTILDMTHLLNVAVLPEFRLRGIGSMLLKNAVGELKRLQPNTKLTLEVRQSNIAAIRLYEKFGFKVTGKRTKYYQKPEDDAILMELDVSLFFSD